MTQFVEQIDAYTTAFLDENYPGLDVKLFGFTELVKKTSENSEQPFPVVINGTGDRSNVQVSLDDEFDFISWVRLPGRITAANTDDDNWGLKEGRRQSAGLRWVIAHDVTLGENLITELVSSIPTILYNIPGFEFVFVDAKLDIDADYETIYRTELGDTVYEKHRFDWNIYVVEINIEFIICNGAELRITEDGIYRILE